MPHGQGPVLISHWIQVKALDDHQKCVDVVARVIQHVVLEQSACASSTTSSQAPSAPLVANAYPKA